MRNERVLITGARAPVALHLARLLHEAGCFVVLADSLRHGVAFASRCCNAKVVLPPINTNRVAAGDMLANAIGQHNITHVIPTCEEVFYLADIWRTRDMGASLFAPNLPQLTEVHHKYNFIRVAQRLGLQAPQTHLLLSADDVAYHSGNAKSMVFKPVWSRFGNDVHIRPTTLNIRANSRFPWVAQDYVQGRLCSVHAFGSHGKVNGVAAYHPRYRVGHGAGTAFAPLQDPDIDAFVHRFVEGTNWHGQISFDFIRNDTGLWAIECNPRATSGLHLFTRPAAFAAALFDGTVVQPDARGLHAVKLAMRLYGVFSALRDRKLKKFINDLHGVTDVMTWPNDDAPRKRQWRAVAEIASIAAGRRISLHAAATQDIEWNGPD